MKARAFRDRRAVFNVADYSKTRACAIGSIGRKHDKINGDTLSNHLVPGQTQTSTASPYGIGNGTDGLCRYSQARPMVCGSWFCPRNGFQGPPENIFKTVYSWPNTFSNEAPGFSLVY